MRVVFDTCVLLDALCDRTPFNDCANELLRLAAKCKIDGIITVNSLMDVHYVAKKSYGDEGKTRKAIKGLLEIFYLADSKASDCQRALNIPVKDFEDALMIVTACNYRADYIITRNVKDYEQSLIKVLTPEEFMTYR